MDKQILARIFVMISYMIGAYGIPVYLGVQLINWQIDNSGRILAILTALPLGVLMGLWFLISLGIFGYSLGEEE